MDVRRDIGSWLEGPPSAGTARLALPAAGPGSRASTVRRLVALAVDWVACLAIAGAVAGRGPFAPLVVLFVENVVLVSTIGTTLGHRLLGVRVYRLGGADGREPVAGPPGLRAGLVRTVLLLLVLPAVVWDADGRGMHDRLAGTLILRTGR